MYGGIMADIVTKAVRVRPTIVTFHGSDLLGENCSGWVRKLISSYGVWLSNQAARRADGVVLVSNALQASLPKNIERSKTEVIPCGIDS